MSGRGVRLYKEPMQGPGSLSLCSQSESQGQQLNNPAPLTWLHLAAARRCFRCCGWHIRPAQRGCWRHGCCVTGSLMLSPSLPALVRLAQNPLLPTQPVALSLLKQLQQLCPNAAGQLLGQELQAACPEPWLGWQLGCGQSETGQG